MTSTKKIVTAAMIAALTTITTIIIRIPSPTGGYIHPGDGVVLLSGLILGPFWGIFAAAVGSAFTDFIGGYIVFVPATFIIKALGAFFTMIVFNFLEYKSSKKASIKKLVISGVVGEFIIVLGYFIFEAFLFASSMTLPGILSGAIASAASIPANCLQAILGVAVYTATYPAIKNIKRLNLS